MRTTRRRGQRQRVEDKRQIKKKEDRVRARTGGDCVREECNRNGR